MELKVWVSIAYHNKSNTFMKSHYSRSMESQSKIHSNILVNTTIERAKISAHNMNLIFHFFENGKEFTILVPETELWNSGDHKFWNHEMRWSPLVVKLCSNIQCKLSGF